MYKLLNNEKVKLTAEEEAFKEAEIEQANINRQAREVARVEKETKKASGKQKLLDLGLSEEEVKALIGI
jgi:hypothetical protein